MTGMSGVRVRINKSAIDEILNSPEVNADIQRRVNAVRDYANSMFSANGYKGDVMKTDRPHGAVWAGDLHSRRSNAKHNTLMRALDAGKGEK